MLIPRAVVVYGRHLLLVREGPGRRSPSPGRWHLPGGEVLEAESPQKAAQRLVKLRSGLDVDIAGCIDALARRGADPVTGKPGPLLHLYFLCRPAADTPSRLLPLEACTDGTAAGRSLPGDGSSVPAGLQAPPGGSDWGWTDLESGLAALKHDLVGPTVISYLESLVGTGA